MKMKIIVPIKKVIDAYFKIRVKPDHTGVETAQAKMTINPFDEIAIEEALRIKEKLTETQSEVILVSVGNRDCQETLRQGLALGADSAILVQSETIFQPLGIAKILAKLVEQYEPQLVILGKQSIDEDNNQTGQMLAGLLNWPQATYASKLEIKEKEVVVTSEIDGGLETLALTLPAIITTDLRLNQPRYATLPNIMKSKSKPLTVIPYETLNLSWKNSQEILSVEPPQLRKAGILVSDVAELVDHLKNKEHII